MRRLRGIVQSQWTSSFIAISPQRLNSLLVFTSSHLGAPNLVRLGAIVLLTGFGRKNSFFISGNWAGDPVDVNSTPFRPFTSPLGHLHPKDMFFFLCLSVLFYLFLV